VRKNISPTVAVLVIVVVVVVAVLVWRKFLSQAPMSANTMALQRRKHQEAMAKAGRLKNPGRRGAGAPGGAGPGQ